MPTYVYYNLVNADKKSYNLVIFLVIVGSHPSKPKCEHLKHIRLDIFG